MRLLVLGGTGFLGYHVVGAALAEGHEVSVFTRGGEAPDPRVEVIPGDRYGDLSVLEGREWEAVLDTFSDPDPVSRTARLLSGRVETYGFISGITNYHPSGPGVVDENSPLRTSGEASPDDPLQERGLQKLACEEAVLEGFSGETLITRVGIMVGPRDPTDRFSWWPARFARALSHGPGAEILAPGEPNRPVQFTDARDLALWISRMLDSGTGGIYNGVGPGRRESLSSVLDACRRAALESLYPENPENEDPPEPGLTDKIRLTWVGEDFLAANLSHLSEEERPLWFPEPQIPFSEVDSSRAIRHGLSFRPALDTARDTLRWLGPRARDSLASGLSPDLERHLLGRWHDNR